VLEDRIADAPLFKQFDAVGIDLQPLRSLDDENMIKRY
jgi:hypothetical protein